MSIEAEAQQVIHECCLLKSLYHPNIIKVHDCYKTRGSIRFSKILSFYYSLSLWHQLQNNLSSSTGHFFCCQCPIEGSSEEIAINHNPLSLWHLAKLSHTSVVLSNFQISKSTSCFLLIKYGPLLVVGLEPTIS